MRAEEQALHNAPPRLSDLRGDTLRAALIARHEANRERWWNNRNQGAGMLAGIMRRIGL